MDNQISLSTAQSLELCVVELMNNAYIHSYSEIEGKPIDVECRIRCDQMSDFIELRVSDYGASINEMTFNQHKNKQIEGPNLMDDDSWSASGRGLMLVAQLSDQFKLEKEIGKNTFVLVKRNGEKLTTKQDLFTPPGP
ncbi:ATP-binding protein [Vibrio diabolicus]|uniref:ATP-binding protein n=2 Tax=Vibrionaceae TaxID=641 RepID=UPI00215BDB81|nr:ATP-binding protein [Vibrio diabolicus]MCR9302513.1 ATP-binding protein [Vibrio diabolicus]MCR9428679.1 ATP-binding protein [Vibrio diabolicus]MDV5035326.1 ATP-binding protein [Vibrio diabolicus]